MFTSCRSTDNNSESSSRYSLTEKNEANKNPNYVIPEGSTIGTRYSTPEGFTRVEGGKGSFEEFLRNQKLKPYGEKALYYNGREKPSKGVYDSVIDVDIGDRDLHQCADAIMLLRAEYLYSIRDYDNVQFNFVSGFEAKYRKWMEGYRIKVEGNDANEKNLYHRSILYASPTNSNTY